MHLACGLCMVSKDTLSDLSTARRAFALGRPHTRQVAIPR
ncbi:Uncharacterized 9.0 kDa protein in mobE 3'region (fragment) [Roseovarius sp. EC-HK134]